MYSFRSGNMYINNFKVAADYKAGTPVSITSAGTLVVTPNGEALDGILTSDVKSGEYCGFQSDGFCATSIIDGTSAIAIGDNLVVSGGKLIKHAGTGVVVGKAMTAVVDDMSAKTKEDAFPDGLRLPEILIVKASGTVLS